ncbi:hypothetical protein B0H67DRAFT_566047 [Lasiosphaeris hirsuta]|uniref:Lysyl-tRNA synthetase n=1 Tax=Lasiosphaeris hirsuta TaxID=260670 RepID=A0AA40EC13_9PEZI|nr:hypothetical protein B0H67DRAFT_566047 [Lasiosphaeris hirsuta]
MRPILRIQSRPLRSNWSNLLGVRNCCVRDYSRSTKANVPKYPRIEHSGIPMRIPEFREKYRGIETHVTADEEVVLRGRVQFIRKASSKLIFIVLKSEFEQVQGLFNFGKLEAAGVTLDSFKTISTNLQRGHIISVTGKATRTPSGELSIGATQMPDILSPNLLPLPVDLSDVDTRIGNRHVDMLVNRKTVDTLRLRSYLIKYMREFFHERHFLEFQTPILAGAAGGAAAAPFTTATTDSLSKDLSMRIAPELWLKRLVVGGVDKVFELGPSFRNEGIDQTHNPEFTTCEFYSAYANLDDLIHLTETLVYGIAEHCSGLIATKLESLAPVEVAKYRGPFKQLEFLPVLEAELDMHFPDLVRPDAFADLTQRLEAKGITHKEPTLAKLLDKLAAGYLEPHSRDAALFITHHPVCMSPLAKSFICPRTGQQISARAELFMDEKEMANMYEEENDPAAQRQKFVDQVRQQQCDGGGVADEEILIDEGYVQVLESGLPPTGGWGCGIERLVMQFSGSKRISEVLSFGNLRNVVAASRLRKPRVDEVEA